MKKVVCIALAAVLGISAIVTGLYFLFRAKYDTLPDIRETPIPQVLDVASAPTVTAVSTSPVDVSAATEKADEDSAMLFGVRYAAEVYRSEETYLNADHVEAAVQRKTFYKDSSGSVKYTALVNKETMAVYDAQSMVYYHDTYAPQTDYLTEPVHWYYKDGQLACAELCFYDGDNTGVAYYAEDGTLVCVYTEIFSAAKDGSVQVSNVYYDSDFAEITQDVFLSLVPKTDADEFLYIHWN